MFILKCKPCGWIKTTTGIPDELKDLQEIKNNCKLCGKPRQFRCPQCQNIVKMVRVKK